MGGTVHRDVVTGEVVEHEHVFAAVDGVEKPAGHMAFIAVRGDIVHLRIAVGKGGVGAACIAEAAVERQQRRLVRGLVLDGDGRLAQRRFVCFAC